MTDVTAHRYTVNAHTTGDGVAEVTANSATMPFDRSWPNTEQASLPGPGELLASAFAACAIKNVERFSQILPFAYDSAEIDVELHRNDHPSRFDRIDYVLRIVTNEPDARVDLLARNLAKHGTVYNTLAAGCEISGRIETTPPLGAVETSDAEEDRSSFDRRRRGAVHEYLGRRTGTSARASNGAPREGEHQMGTAWDINDNTADQDEQQVMSESGGIPATEVDYHDAPDDRGLDRAGSESDGSARR